MLTNYDRQQRRTAETGQTNARPCLRRPGISYELQIALDIENELTFTGSSTLSSLSCKAAVLVTPDQTFDLIQLGHSDSGFIQQGSELTVRFLTSKNGVKSVATSKLHPVISARMLAFFAEGEPEADNYEEYCCFDFVHELIFGRGCIPAYTDFDECFLQRRLSTRYNVHDVVVIATAKDDRLHYAMSIDHGLFISKFGVHGHLAVTTLDELMKFYRGEFHYRLTAQRDMRSAFFNEDHQSSEASVKLLINYLSI